MSFFYFLSKLFVLHSQNIKLFVILDSFLSFYPFILSIYPFLFLSFLSFPFSIFSIFSIFSFYTFYLFLSFLSFYPFYLSILSFFCYTWILPISYSIHYKFFFPLYVKVIEPITFSTYSTKLSFKLWRSLTWMMATAF